MEAAIQERESIATRMKYFVMFAIQVVFTWLLVTYFQLEKNSGVPQLAIYWCGAALLHFWLPKSWRLSLVVLTTAVTVIHALGIFSGVIFYLITGCFVVTAHLKIKRIYRTLLILAGVVFLIALRLQFLYMPRVYVAIPLVGMFFMFRFILYWYELKYETKPSSWGLRLSYLYNPLNAAFPLFPVFDFKAWQRNYYDQQEVTIYATAFRRIFFGVLLMLLYRLLYAHNPNPANIQTAQELLLYFFFSYIFLIRILGIFWFTLGFLGLFGFNLPKVFDQVFFITRFSNIWRQMNIYWKDFIQKIAYFPLYFKLRKKLKSALFVSGIVTFFITWFFHNWQYFWIKGSFPLRTTDFLYWMILGFVITASMHRESKQPAPTGVRYSVKDSIIQTLRATGMFIFLCAMWSFWNSNSVGEWFYLVSFITKPSGDIFTLLFIFCSLVIGAGVLYHNRKFLTKTGERLNKIQHSLAIGVVALCVLVITLEKAGMRDNHIVTLLINQPTNQFDQETAEQGYYEQIGSSTSENPWQIQVNARGRSTWFSAAETPCGDVRMRQLKTNFSITYDGMTFTTNKFGMRNPEITEKKPARTMRIAVLGASYEMGGGVSDEECFIRLFEKQLNDSMRAEGDSTTIQVLNFAVGAYHVPQYVWLCENEIFKYEPDVVMTFAHSSELRRLNGVTARLIQNGVDLSEYPELKQVRDACGAQQSMSRTEIRNRLYPYNEQLLKWGYKNIVAACEAHHATPIWVYLPALGDNPTPQETESLISIAKMSGFQTISLATVYNGEARETLVVSLDDSHPNKQGHAIIAAALYDGLVHPPYLDSGPFQKPK